MIPVSFETITIPVAFDVNCRVGWFELDGSGDLTLWRLKREPFTARIWHDPRYGRLSRSQGEIAELRSGRPCLGATGFEWLKQKSLRYEHLSLLLSNLVPISLGSAFLDWHLPTQHFSIAVYLWEVGRLKNASAINYNDLVQFLLRVESLVRLAVSV